MTCSASECERKVYARDLCRKHYTRLWRAEGRITPEARFSRSFEVTAAGCWHWTANTDQKGYGLLAVGGSRKARAHRWAYERFVAPIPDGAQIHHRCLNPSCVNPDHLEPVTNEENQRRRWATRQRCCECGSYNVERVGDLDITIA